MGPQPWWGLIVILVGNGLNGKYLAEVFRYADSKNLEQVDLAVAYVKSMDEIFDVAKKRDVPLNLYALVDGHGFPGIPVVRRFLNGGLGCRLYLTRNFFHTKIMWFRGVGAYIGSANLTGAAAYDNLECGVWLSNDELHEQDWIDELSSMFRVVHARCREVSKEDLAALVELAERRKPVLEAERAFNRDVERLLATIPGTTSPVDRTKRTEAGGAGRKAFVSEWHNGLSILRVMADMFESHRGSWPSWVDSEVPATIVQDQATEWWWDTTFRRSGESRKEMEKAHKKNASNPRAAVQGMLEAWLKVERDPSEHWVANMNTNPTELKRLLVPEQLRQLNLDHLQRILHLCHASREHGRQIRNRTLGLAEGEERSTEERSGIFANYLWNYGHSNGTAIRRLLEFALWGDKFGHAGVAPEERLWTATRSEDWKVPHIGTHILGELLGYARPDLYPPRNNRVSKTLYALGFDVDYE